MLSEPGKNTAAADKCFLRLLFRSGRGVLFLLLIFSAWPVPPALATDLNASWEYVMSGDDDAETQELLLQKYNLGTGFLLEPTHAIAAGANFAYSRSETSTGGVNKVLTPSANLSLNNDIFTASLSGTLSENRRATSATLNTYAWSANLGSNWGQQNWPSFSLYYDRDGSDSDDGRIDIKT